MEEIIKKQILDTSTGQYVEEFNDTGVITIGDTQTPSAAGPVTIISINVPAGGYLYVSEIDVFSSASATFLASYSYTTNGQPVAGNKYYYLASAGFIPDVQSLNRPIITMPNASTATQTFKISVPSASANTLYGANIRYIIQ